MRSKVANELYFRAVVFHMLEHHVGPPAGHDQDLKVIEALARFLKSEVGIHGQRGADADGAAFGDGVGGESGFEGLGGVGVGDVGEHFDGAGEVEEVSAGEEENGDLVDLWGGVGGRHGVG